MCSDDLSSHSSHARFHKVYTMETDVSSYGLWAVFVSSESPHSFLQSNARTKGQIKVHLSASSSKMEKLSFC